MPQKLKKNHSFYLFFCSISPHHGTAIPLHWQTQGGQWVHAFSSSTVIHDMHALQEGEMEGRTEWGRVELAGQG